MDPWLYYGQHKTFYEDIPFWENIALKTGSPILELGCGTGRVSLELAQHNMNIIGIDNDISMLRVQQALTPPHAKNHIHLVQADFTDYYFHAHFPLILLPCNTFSTIPLSTRINTLTNIHKHLTSNGLFVVSIINPAILENLPTSSDLEFETNFFHPKDQNPVQVFTGWSKQAHYEITFTWVYDHLYPDGKVERQTFSTTHYYTNLENTLKEFQTAGFQHIEYLGDFHNNPYQTDSPYLIVKARI